MSHEYVPPHLWSIHGRLYDFNNFVDKHPGGRTYILTGRGRECTELFESVHALCKTDLNKFIEPYLVKDEAVKSIELPKDVPRERLVHGQDYFSWDEKGFYSVLKERVRNHLKGENYKATYGYWVKVSIMLILAVLCLKNFYKGSFIYSFLYGCLLEMLGFCVMHDASHGAVSKQSWINEMSSIIWNSWTEWSHWLWMQHHVLAHHSYTSVYLKDPDVVHWSGFLRKTHDADLVGFQKYQSKYWWFIVGLWPNQHLGQMIAYQISLFYGRRLFGMPLTPPPEKEKKIEYALKLVSLLVHYIIPYFILPFKVALTCQFLMLTGMGLSYWLNVAPNHDTMPSLEALDGKEAKKMDWGELQVRSSGNHSNSDSLLDTTISTLWGGMNYQIEHHLFPSISHCHYPKIAPIVKETCKEFNIPYPCHDSWFAAMKSYIQLLTVMEKK